MNRKLHARITIEAAIVFPVIMMVVVSFIYMALYTHDILTIKSYAYGLGVKNITNNSSDFICNVRKQGKKVPLLVLKTEWDCDDKGTYYEILIDTKNTSSKWMKDFIGTTLTQKRVVIEKSMSTEIMYGYRAVRDELIDKKK